MELSEERVGELLSQKPMREYIQALDTLLKQYGKGEARNTYKHVHSDNPQHVVIEFEAEIPGWKLRKRIDEQQNGKTRKKIVTTYTGSETFTLHGGHITDLRTGIAGALAAHYLGKEPKTIAVIGAGNVAQAFGRAAEELFHPEEIRFATRSESSRRAYKHFLEEQTHAAVQAYDVYNPVHRKHLLTDATMLFIAAPLNEPLLLEQVEYMAAGSHISCMTGDGKQHLFAPDVMTSRAVIVDDLQAAQTVGEWRWVKGDVTYLGTIGDVALKPLDETRDTFYDSTGMGISDGIGLLLRENQL